MTKGEANRGLPLTFAFAGYLVMKKLIVFIVLLLLTSCMYVPRKEEPKEIEQYIIVKKNHAYVIDMCTKENMPRYPNRPKLKAEELKDLSEAEMDKRIKKHIDDLEKHIDVVEGVILKTRRLVEDCR
jgi:hypothetical protein